MLKTWTLVCCLLPLLPAINPSLEELIVHLLLLRCSLPLNHLYLLCDSEMFQYLKLLKRRLFRLLEAVVLDNIM